MAKTIIESNLNFTQQVYVLTLVEEIEDKTNYSSKEIPLTDDDKNAILTILNKYK